MRELPDKKPATLDFPARKFPLGERTLVMGILNVTPDSFSDGGEYLDTDIAVKHALDMIGQGADIIDIGGESSRPFAEPVGEDEELSRVIPVVEELVARTDIPISIDTYKPAVARRAVLSGAAMINDISGGKHGTLEIALQTGVPIVLMHMAGTPQTMQAAPNYDDVVAEIAAVLRDCARSALDLGLEPSQIVLDPGIGFGKTVNHNLEIIANLDKLAALNFPLLVGPSRKSFIADILGLPVDQRQEGTDAAVAACALSGVHIVRVHDVKQTVRITKICDAIRAAHREA